MRKILATVGVVALLGGIAPAQEAGELGREKIVKVHRWAFDIAGRDPDMARLCLGGSGIITQEHRTGQDIAAAIFSAGWYTPKTVHVTCSGSSSAKR